MEKAHTIFAVAVLLLLSSFLAGCGTGSDIPTPYTGSQGLYMEFHPSSPPASVNPGKSFRIIIYLSNYGASDITSGRVYLTNIVDNDISVVGDKSKTFTLYGRTDKIPQGEKKVVTWDASAISKQDHVVSEISAAAEYGYTTNAVTPICIDPARDTDTGFNNIGKPCIMQREITLTDQGAPVAVKQIIADIDPDAKQITLTIGVQNVGGGYISAGTIDTSYLGFLDSEVKLAGQPIICESSRIAITDDVGQIVCYADYASDTAYTTTLQIKLDYIYRQTLSAKEIEIRKTTVIP
jgi:hypothetical protein